MYDSYNDRFYKNPNYNVLYDPSGLVYDAETARKVMYNAPDLYDFMQSRAEVPYDELKKRDVSDPIIDQICQHYGIPHKYVKPGLLGFLRGRL